MTPVISGSFDASENANGCSRRTLAAAPTRAANAVGSAAPISAAISSRSLAPDPHAQLAGHTRDVLRGRRQRIGEVDRLEQPVHQRPARPSLESTPSSPVRAAAARSSRRPSTRSR